MTEIVGYDSFGAPLLSHQVTGRTMYECPGCGAEFSSPFGAVTCEEDHAAEDRRLGRSSD